MGVVGGGRGEGMQWDIVDKLADEEEGEGRTMREKEGNPVEKAREEERRERGKSSPERGNEQSLQTIFERMNKAKQEGPKESDHWRFKVPQGTPKS